MTERTLNGRYRLHALLGQGGMAVVWDAEDLLLGRRVAVKALRPEYAADPDVIQRFRREARAAAALSHPNIVAVYDVGEDAGTHYIVMEFVEGQTLKEFLARHGALDPSQVVQLGAQLAAAIDHAHRHGVIHRDVKPHNILLTPDLQVKVADFGIAVAVGTPTVTQAGTVWGSALYMAPEQVQGRGNSPATDIYALGVVLYEMATGVPPFQGDSPLSVALQHLEEEPTPPREINPRVPPALEATILRALAKDPASRPATASELRRELLDSERLGAEMTMPVRVATQRADRGVSRPLQGAAVAPVPAKPAPSQRAASWPLLLLGLLSGALLLGLIPLGYIALREAQQALGAAPPSPAAGASPSPGASPNPTQAAGLGGEPTATPTLAARPTPTPTPSRSPTPSPTATPLPVVVPDLRGENYESMRRVLQSQGLELVAQERQYHDEVPEGHIVAQLVPAGTALPHGSKVEVVVSLGPTKVSMPNVVGRPLSEVRPELERLGFQVDVREEFHDTAPAGTVIGQDPAAGKEVGRGGKVRLVVSKGQQLVAVPDVIGWEEKDAREAIRKAGLQDDPWPDPQRHATIPPGHVISTLPGPNEKVKPGTVVKLAVSIGR